MSDQREQDLLRERLELVLEALERIPRRLSGVSNVEEFSEGERGQLRVDGICMILIAAGEEFKKIDHKTEGKLFARYPHVQWRGAIGLRNVLAHGYFDVDAEQLYTICKERIPPLIETLKQMIADLQSAE